LTELKAPTFLFLQTSGLTRSQTEDPRPLQMDVRLYGTDDGDNDLPRPICVVEGKHRRYNGHCTNGIHCGLTSDVSFRLKPITDGI